MIYDFANELQAFVTIQFDSIFLNMLLYTHHQIRNVAIFGGQHLHYLVCLQLKRFGTMLIHAQRYQHVYMGLLYHFWFELI